MDNIWIVRLTISPLTERNNIIKLWYKVVAPDQLSAAYFVLDKERSKYSQYRLKHLEVTVDHQPIELPRGILEWGEDSR